MLFDEILPKDTPTGLRAAFHENINRLNKSPELSPAITLDNIKHTLNYTNAIKLPSFNTHIGQRKLFIGELQFLTEFTSSNADSIIIYAGAAPSNHTGFLAKLFPRARFLLVDPNPFKIYDFQPPQYLRAPAEFVESPARICIINDLYTTAISRELLQSLQGKHVLFISDIRTNAASEIPADLDIIWNLSQQLNWIMALKPAASMLKYRHPFYDSIDSMARIPDHIAGDLAESAKHGIDFAINFATRKLVYLPGKCNIQCWQGERSTETRLITKYDWNANPRTGCTFIERESVAEYENKLFYYNSCERGLGYHINPLADRALGFDHCGDCAIEYDAWNNYKHKFAPDLDILANVRALSQNTRRPLTRETHGMLFQRPDAHFAHIYTQLYKQKNAN